MSLFSKTASLDGRIFVTAFADSGGLRRISVGFQKAPSSRTAAPRDVENLLDRTLSAAASLLQGNATPDAREIVRKITKRSGQSDFRRKVYTRLVEIPHGQTRTYSELASLVGGVKYRRAVAQALAANPFPILIPCHRVVGARDEGGYSAGGGRKMKQSLLSMEAAA